MKTFWLRCGVGDEICARDQVRPPFSVLHAPVCGVPAKATFQSAGSKATENTQSACTGVPTLFQVAP
ncbi:MAG TPA: hypothetical protein VF632_00045 [Longimicrobium sp.]